MNFKRLAGNGVAAVNVHPLNQRVVVDMGFLTST
jgi:hypothetical protein